MMKYKSVNSLQDFEFHDASMEFVSFRNGQLVVAVKHLNVHKNTEQNGQDKDMEIEQAQMTFENFSVKHYENMRAQELGDDGTYHDVEPVIAYVNEAAQEKLFSLWNKDLWVLALDRYDDELYYMDVDAWLCTMFTIRFCFDSVTVTWDDFSGPAWYVK